MSCNLENYEEAISPRALEPNGFFKKFVARWKLRGEQQTARAAFQNVLQLEDEMLKDIGVTRDDVNWANGLPIDRNASLEVQKIAAMRNRRVL